jgi:hypothetical protein
LTQLITIGQAERLFSGPFSETLFYKLLDDLVIVDHFYREIGGLLGYQKTICSLLAKREEAPSSSCKFHSPAFIDISKESEESLKFTDWGIDALPFMAEIYPLGGAADRLHLIEKQTGMELPAAKLPFAGKALLEHLINDLEARELLYFQKYGVRLITPVAIMTSLEKNNHAHVMEICESLQFFGRPRDSFRFFTQPLVPTVDAKGDWLLQGPCKPLLKPGGHGAIWKLAKDSGTFAWLKSLGRTKALVRQINNPIAGLDYGLLAFIGIGCKRDMHFGFASAPRLLKAAEGVNVLVEKEKEVVLTNIEYCDFDKFGIEDCPLVEGSPYSRFSSNTNLLFVDLEAISKAVELSPFPGLLINLKKASYTLSTGEKKEELMARLESTMQNIADVFVEPKREGLRLNNTYVTYNQRKKTISTAKKAFVRGGPIQETPENCFYDLLFVNRELLLECGFQLPEQRDIERYLQEGPEVIFLYHPTLGPLYSIIRDKLKGGSLALGSELIIEMAKFHAVDLNIEGSLQIIGPPSSRCILDHVTVRNRGVNWGASEPFWQMNLHRRETAKIILKENSTLIVRNREILGNKTYALKEGEVLEI